jgi:AraC-like DNA-binding protein
MSCHPSPDPAVPATREPPPLLDTCRLYCSPQLGIHRVVARPTSELPSDEYEVSGHAIVLPYQGVFATQAGRGVPVVAAATHAVLLSPSIPYRYSYPGAIGDRCLVLLWSDETLGQLAPHGFHRDFDTPESGTAPVLDFATMLAREELRRALARPDADPLAVEELSLALLSAVLRAARGQSSRQASWRARTAVRARRRVERVKQLVCVEPARRWTLDALASTAHVSTYHFAHEFKAAVGVSVYEYVLRARLASALERVVDSSQELTTIALDAGFSSASHFTAHFRARFGTTPLALRRQGARRELPALRRIATAELHADS